MDSLVWEEVGILNQPSFLPVAGVSPYLVRSDLHGGAKTVRAYPASEDGSRSRRREAALTNWREKLLNLCRFRGLATLVKNSSSSISKFLQRTVRFAAPGLLTNPTFCAIRFSICDV